MPAHISSSEASFASMDAEISVLAGAGVTHSLEGMSFSLSLRLPYAHISADNPRAAASSFAQIPAHIATADVVGPITTTARGECYTTSTNVCRAHP